MVIHILLNYPTPNKMDKSAMQQLSIRLDNIIKYYDDEHGTPSSYHFRMLKKILDSEYLRLEKKQLIEAYDDALGSCESLDGLEYYASKFNK